MADLRKKVLSNQIKPSGGSGGIEASSWESYFDERKILESGFCVYSAGPKTGAVCVMLHGAGLNSLSWAVAAKHIKAMCGVLAFDMRGHGDTTVPGTDMSKDELVADVLKVLKEVYGDNLPPLVLCGHSMGGAIAIRCSPSLPKNILKALVVVDVVEGTAMASLPKMTALLGSRPKSFNSVSDAISWAITSGMIKNKESASVSVPPQVKEADGHYVWKTDLQATSKFWAGWFQNMSTLFLNVVGPKLLILADTDRLDKDLTIGQMMGQFQMSIIPGVGHHIQEDAPEKTAAAITTFLQRFRIAS